MRSAFLETGVIRFCRSSPQPGRLRAVLGLLLGLGVMNIYPSAQAQALLNNIVQVAAGSGHTCALTSAGGVKCWGSNDFGQLGDGTWNPRRMPADVNGLSSGVSAIATGTNHTCALTSGGGVKCWGSNDDRQLGDGSTTARRIPVDVIGLTSGVSAIAAGGSHGCALTQEGGVKCWGGNIFGQLGNGHDLTTWTATDVVGLASGVSGLAAGGFHTCAQTTAGGVKCWGANFDGQVGDGTTTRRLTPVDVSGLTGGVTTVAAGFYHTCALTTGGGAKCWGGNVGTLGDGTTVSRLTPVDVTGLSSGVSAIVAGLDHTCALTGGGIKCWGWNSNGEVGDGSTNPRLTPVAVSGLSNGMGAIAAGHMHACGVAAAGEVQCWGRNVDGQLGDNTTTVRFAPVEVSGLSSAVGVIAAGESHSCALSTGSGVDCWGLNASGQLGDGTTERRLAPVGVAGLSGDVVAIAAGRRHTCVLTSVGSVMCWGSNFYGALGDGTTTNRLTPVPVSGLTAGVSAIAAGDFHTCAVVGGGGVKCWGRNHGGQLGDGTTTQRLTPVDVGALTSGVRAIDAGEYHTCVLTNENGVKCWGDNSAGQLGDGTTSRRLSPVDVTSMTSGVNAISAGGRYTCAITNGGAVRCWGSNSGGQLGNGSPGWSSTPVGVPGLTSGFSAINAGVDHTCALSTGGGVTCWGNNFLGKLGSGGPGHFIFPVGVLGLSSGVSAIALGAQHSCALTSGGGLKCWGSHQQGQLGIGGRNYALPGNVLMPDLVYSDEFELAP
jgi:alpha-tubulin suppressor-like RCC1 family protein